MPLGSNKAALFGASAQAGGARGLFCGGEDDADRDIIDYINIASTGNATDFGNLLSGRNYPAGCSNGSSDRGVSAGGYDGTTSPLTAKNVIEYVTISSAGNSQDFGDLTHEKYGHGGTSNLADDRGVFMAGNYISPAGRTSDIDYITISSTGNGTDFGDYSPLVAYGASTSNGSNDRGVYMGGFKAPADNANEISYITITSTGNSSDFGDLLAKSRGGCAFSNSTNERGLHCGGPRGTYESDPISNVIEYITINSTGNATDFGDMVAACDNTEGVSNGTDDRGVVHVAKTDGETKLDTLEYVTISSAGNAADFGDLTVGRHYGSNSGMGSNSD
tara:strand:- start:1278 stop:2276 length:999 start_codon:yes stop_codon:yes gene_type:complete